MSWGIREALAYMNHCQNEINTSRDAIEGLGGKVDLVDGEWVEIEVKKEETNGTTTSPSDTQKKA